MDGADARVIERRSGAGFALKALQSHGILGQFFGKEFQGNETAQPRVFGLINDTHSAAAQFFNDPVVRYKGANHAMNLVKLSWYAAPDGKSIKGDRREIQMPPRKRPRLSVLRGSS